MSGILATTLERALGESGSKFIGVDGTTTEPADLVQCAYGIASSLRKAGIYPNEPVHLEVSNRPADIASLLGIWLAGAVAVPVRAANLDITKIALAKITSARFCVSDLQLVNLSELPPPHRPLLAEAAAIIFTSGTTGAPKGVVIGHDAFYGKIQVLEKLLALRLDDVVLIPLQINFIFGLWTTLVSVFSGSDVILIEKFSPDRVRPLLEDSVTVFGAVPTMLRGIFSGTAPTARSLRMVLTGGEALSPALNRKLAEIWPRAAVYDLYGLTETGSCDFCLRPHEQDAGIGSIGTPTDAIETRIVKVDGSIAGDGDIGELEINSPFRMLGYLDAPDLTKAAFNGDFFRCGDLVRVRPDKKVEIVGRIKEIISRGGNKIAPLEIDNLLCSHPNVASALCAGVPDEQLGERIHAIVVLKHDARIGQEELLKWASSRIEKYKLPEEIYFLDELPLGSTGKASRIIAKDFILQRRASCANS